MKYYPNTIDFLAKKIKEKFSEAGIKEGQNDIPSHLLWMMRKMQSFDDSAKRGRWIGWILAHAEMLGIMTNKQSRKLAKRIRVKDLFNKFYMVVRRNIRNVVEDRE